MVSHTFPINFLTITNNDVTGTIQLAREMPNFTFMHPKRMITLKKNLIPISISRFTSFKVTFKLPSHVAVLLIFNNYSRKVK